MYQINILHIMYSICICMVVKQSQVNMKKKDYVLSGKWRLFLCFGNISSFFLHPRLETNVL